MGGGEQPGKGLERKEETRCDPSCQRALQEADRASNAGREVGTPPPVSSTDYAPSAASDPLAYAAHRGIPTEPSPPFSLFYKECHKALKGACAGASRGV